MESKRIVQEERDFDRSRTYDYDNLKSICVNILMDIRVSTGIRVFFNFEARARPGSLRKES